VVYLAISFSWDNFSSRPFFSSNESWFLSYWFLLNVDVNDSCDKDECLYLYYLSSSREIVEVETFILIRGIININVQQKPVRKKP